MAPSTHSSLPAISTFVSVLLFWMLLPAGVYSQNIPSNVDIDGLLKFKYDNLQVWGPGPAYWINWGENDGSPCRWMGVTCTKSIVTGLDLSGWASLKGTMGGSMDALIDLRGLSNLQDLRELDLSSNGLRAVYDLQHLTYLRRLDLSSNDLLHFPEGMSQLTNLTWVDLSSNAIIDSLLSFNFTSCTKLWYISLRRNNLFGEIPPLGALPNLQFLDLANNQLSGPFPTGLTALKSILIVDLSNNFLSGKIPSLPNATNLAQLKLDINEFTGFEEPWFVGSNLTLSSLSVSENRLTGEIPRAIMDMPSLQFLNFSSNLLSGPIHIGFSKLSLQSLDLSNNRFVQQIPSDLLNQWASTSSPYCPILKLSHNGLTGPIPDVAGYRCFDTLDLSYNQLSGTIPSNFFSYDSKIYFLWLQNNRLTGDIIDGLFTTHGITYLLEAQLQNNRFTGDLTRLANGTSKYMLGLIDLSNNSLQWTASETIPDPISTTLKSWGYITNVLLGGNNFSGTSVPTAACSGYGIFSAPGGLYYLEVLDLSNSHLKGEIMGSTFDSWGCLRSLRVLKLSGNEITGSVPEALLNFPNLQVLDLSHNKLSGSLPTIPPNSSFNNPGIFSDNVGLCGYPLHNCPQNTLLFLIIGGALIVSMGSCLAATWRWRVYQKRHQQDADLINTLLERDSATLMSLRELKKATDNFAQSARIGEGGFGTVYAGKLNDGTVVAIKRSKREGADKDKKQFLNEVRILSQVNHRNLVKLIGCCMENKTAVLVFEFVSNGTLQEHLHENLGPYRLSWQQRLNIAVQTASALTYLHTATALPIYHRDVKSANILLDEKLNAKVADFGISKLAPLQATHVSTAAVQGTMGYIDPEYYTSYRLTGKSDVFSFGVVLLELISAKRALDLSRSEDDRSLVNLVTSHITRGELHKILDPALLETYYDPTGLHRESILNVARVATQCVNMQSKARPTMNEVWTELQILWSELTDTKNLSTRDDVDEDDHELQTLWSDILCDIKKRSLQLGG